MLRSLVSRWHLLTGIVFRRPWNFLLHAGHLRAGYFSHHAGVSIRALPAAPTKNVVARRAVSVSIPLSGCNVHRAAIALALARPDRSVTVVMEGWDVQSVGSAIQISGDIASPFEPASIG